MKAISLPVNVLIIVALAAIVMLGLIAMYFTGFGPFTTAINLEGVKNEACRNLTQTHRCAQETRYIPVYDFDADKDGRTTTDHHTERIVAGTGCAATWWWAADNLFMLCNCYLGCNGTYAEIERCCRQLCMCP